MAYSFFNQYMYYNDVIITLFGEDDNQSPEYIISAINTKSIPSVVPSNQKGAGAHLVSLSITPPDVMDARDVLGVRSNIAAKGTITIVDYKNSLFNRLKQHIKFVNEATATMTSGVCITPKIKIEVRCFTGIEIYDGYVIEYSFTFEGGAPTITLEWSSIPAIKGTPEASQNAIDKTSNKAEYYNISGFYENCVKPIIKEFDIPSNYTKIRFKYDNKSYDNDAAWQKMDEVLAFAGEKKQEGSNETVSYATVDLTSLKDKDRSNNCIMNIYKWLSLNVISKSSDEYIIEETGEMVKANESAVSTEASFSSEETNKTKTVKYVRKPVDGYHCASGEDSGFFVIKLRNTEELNSSAEASTSIVFVQNGRFAPYSVYNFNNISSVTDFKVSPLGTRAVIPTSTISFSTNFANISLQPDILGKPNNNVGDPSGTGTPQQAPPNTGNAVNEAATQANNSQSSATTVGFTCYNVMSFMINNSAAKIAVLVYDEYGDVHPMSGYFTVTKISYDMSGAVVSAKIEANKLFNETTLNGREASVGAGIDTPADQSAGNNSMPVPENNSQEQGNSSR